METIPFPQQSGICECCEERFNMSELVVTGDPVYLCRPCLADVEKWNAEDKRPMRLVVNEEKGVVQT